MSAFPEHGRYVLEVVEVGALREDQWWEGEGEEEVFPGHDRLLLPSFGEVS